MIYKCFVRGTAICALVFVSVMSFRLLADDSSAKDRVPVLVELFTSEGCSSCPPADAFLQKLDEQPFPRTQMIVLSEHVDYWDHLGWRDIYSSRSLTQRQNDYATRFGLNSAYTPQMVVDGRDQFVGTDAGSAQKAFEKAERIDKVPVLISTSGIDPDGSVLAHLEVPALGEKSSVGSADVFVALAFNRATSQVKRGENEGRKLSHVAVVRELVRVGSVKKRAPLQKDVRLKTKSIDGATGLRLIAFVQASGPGPVLGVALKHVQ